jgi:hypothetical protein
VADSAETGVSLTVDYPLNENRQRQDTVGRLRDQNERQLPSIELAESSRVL